MCLVGPTVPRLLTVINATDNAVTLSWMEPNVSNGIITIYQIQYGLAGGGDQQLVLQNVTSLSYTVTGLMSNTPYRFRVAAATRVGLGSYTNYTNSYTTGKLLRGSLYFKC